MFWRQNCILMHQGSVNSFFVQSVSQSKPKMEWSSLQTKQSSIFLSIVMTWVWIAHMLWDCKALRIFFHKMYFFPSSDKTWGRTWAIILKWAQLLGEVSAHRGKYCQGNDPCRAPVERHVGVSELKTTLMYQNAYRFFYHFFYAVIVLYRNVWTV